MRYQSWITGTLIVLAVALVWWRWSVFTRDLGLWGAAQSGQVNTVRRLLSQGANPDASWQGLTALAAAAFRGDDASALLLLAHGANPHRAGLQALHQDRPKILQAMLAHGFQTRGQEGTNFFLGAVQNGYVDDVELLLKAGADPRWVEPTTGHGVLQFAISCSDIKARSRMINLLRRAGAH